MKKIMELSGDMEFPWLKKLFRIMKLSTFLILFSVVCVFASETYSQSKKLNLNIKHATVKEVLSSIEDQSEFKFMYSGKIIDVNREVAINAENSKIEDTLKLLFAGTDIEYTIKDRIIVLSASGLFSNESSFNQQQKSISGKITDSSGSSLPGVSVVVKGTTNGTITDANGKYTIQSVPANATLQFSFVGMKSQEIAVGSQTTINVALAEETVGIDEVVAVGYGTQKKANLTGAISNIGSKEIANRPISNITQAFTGQMVGVTVIQNSGQPGADAGTVRVRGVGTLGNTNAMIIVDGVESSLNAVDPNDVESLTVLKDAAASSIYGVRAANGVILVTTKQGKQGKTVVAYNNYIGWQSATRLPDFLGSADYAILYNEALKNDNPNAVPKYSASDIDKFRNGTDPDHYPNSNWLDALLSGSGFLQNHSLNVSGGSDKTSYYVSLGYHDRNGIIANTDFKRYSIRTNFNNKVTDKFDFSLNIGASRENTVQPVYGVDNIFTINFREIPTIPIRYSDNTYGLYLNEHNSVAFAEQGGTSNLFTNRFQGTLSGTYKLLKGLSLKGLSSFNYIANENYSFSHRQVFYNFDTKNPIKTLRSNVRNTDDKLTEVNLQAFLNYENSFGKHDIKGLLGYSQLANKQLSLTAFRYDLPPSNIISALNAGVDIGQSNGGSGSEYSLRSAFGRLNYTFDQKYLFEANLRYDGTSRFPSNIRYGLFPSFSAGWRLSEEPFLNSIKDIGDFKLRASWGKLGNQEVGSNYPYQNTYVLNQNYTFGGNNPGVAQGISINSVLANSAITWEETTQTDLGLDVTLLKGMFTLGCDYFQKNTDNILLNFPAPDVLGVSPPAQNAGSVRNTGAEVSGSYRNNAGQFTYYSNFNFSYVKNKITDLKGTDYPGRTVGDPIFNIYGLQAIGLFQSVDEISNSPVQKIGKAGSSPGDIKYKDQNGDKVIDSKDRVSLGTYFPEINYGLQLGAAYKNFDVSVSLQGTGNVKGYLARESSEAFFNGGKVLKSHLDRWTPENLDASYPRLTIANSTRNNALSSFWVQDASYLRLRNFQLGYTLPNEVTKQMRIQKLHLFFSGDNLLTFTKFKGFDPEAPYGARGYYPQTKSYTLGLSISF